MAFSQDNIIDKVRENVNDVSAATWAESRFLPFFNEGERWIYDNVQGAKIGSTGAITPFAAAATKSANSILDDIYKIPMTDYLAYCYFRADRGDKRDASRAQEHLTAFLAHFGKTHL